MRRIRVCVDMYDGGAGRFIARIRQDCVCGTWGITITLAAWSNLESISDGAVRHLASCEALGPSSAIDPMDWFAGLER